MPAKTTTLTPAQYAALEAAEKKDYGPTWGYASFTGLFSIHETDNLVMMWAVAEATAMSDDGYDPADVMAEAARRVALALQILNFGESIA